MRRALVVGIDYYTNSPQLHGCVNDSYSVKAMLERHADGSVNFGVKHLTATGQSSVLKRSKLRETVQNLFNGEGEIALFYFAGHGYIDATGGYLCTSEVDEGSEGLSLADVMTMANASKFHNRIIILDSCHSGIVGARPSQSQMTEIGDGATILAASTPEQYATEENGTGVFTRLLVDALGGAAANLVGEITPGGVYAHVDQSLGPWAQRPVFKTNARSFVSLRKVRPAIELSELRKIATLFPEASSQFHLDPTFEPERHKSWYSDPQGLPAPNPDNNATFKILQKYNRAGLVIPEGAEHMWHAAMESKTVRLTALGAHYQRLATKKLI